MIKSFPETVILELVETLKVSIVDPPAPTLPLLNVMVPVPLGGGVLNVKVILVPTPIAVAPLAGLIELNVRGIVVKL